jgi:hypothetical protein
VGRRAHRRTEGGDAEPAVLPILPGGLLKACVGLVLGPRLGRFLGFFEPGEVLDLSETRVERGGVGGSCRERSESGRSWWGGGKIILNRYSGN